MKICSNTVKPRWLTWNFTLIEIYADFLLLCKTHQVRLGHVLVVRCIVRCRFAKAIVASCLWWLSMLSVCGTFWSPAEKVNGFTNTALYVNFCETKSNKSKIRNVNLSLGWRNCEQPVSNRLPLILLFSFIAFKEYMLQIKWRREQGLGMALLETMIILALSHRHKNDSLETINSAVYFNMHVLYVCDLLNPEMEV